MEETTKKNKKYKHHNQVILLLKYRTKRLDKSMIVMTKSCLSEIIEPNGYMTASSLNSYIFTYINPQPSKETVW